MKVLLMRVSRNWVMQMRFSNFLTRSALAASLVVTTVATANVHEPSNGMVIEPPANRVVSQTVTVDDSTRRVDVKGGSVVEFIVVGETENKSFVRQFNTYGHEPRPFSLEEIGPDDISFLLGERGVKVFVSPDDRYINR